MRNEGCIFCVLDLGMNLAITYPTQTAQIYAARAFRYLLHLGSLHRSFI